MGMGAAQDHGMQHTRQCDVIDKSALTGEQAIVFEPFQRLAQVDQ
jgi:hypothetical protein